MLITRLPEEIQVDVFLRLPVKSIQRCRCVCKPLCRLLYNPKFIRDHLLNQKKNNLSLMLISYVEFRNPICRSIDSASILSASSAAPASTVTCDGAIPMNDKFFQRHWEQYERIMVVGSSNGLICIRGANSKFCIWNPTTGEYKILSCFHDTSGKASEMDIVYGFGYDSHIDDYKLVKIVTRFPSSFTQVEVYTLGSKSYKTIQSMKIYQDFYPSGYHVWFLNGAFHWSGFTPAPTSSRVVVSFDITSDRFVDFLYPEEIIDLRRINHPPDDRVGLLEDRLCLMLYGHRIFPIDVWVMQDYGVRELWTKQFSVIESTASDNIYFTLAWSYANGMALIDVGEKKILYDPKNDSSKVFEISGFDHMAMRWSQSVSYVESLVSLNKSGPSFFWLG